MKRMVKIISAALISAGLLAAVSCSGDMHDSDKSLKAYIIYSTADKSLSIPKGTQFNETMEAYGVDGTYGEYSFRKIKITAGEEYTAKIELFDADNNSVYKKETGTTFFVTEYDMTIKLTDSSVIDLTKWNGVKIQ